MPDREGRLSSEEKQKVLGWLRTKWKTPLTCPISHDNNWLLSDFTVAPANFSGGGIVIGGQSTPQVMLICKSCGYTLYFNAVLIGIFPPAEKHDGK